MTIARRLMVPATTGLVFFAAETASEASATVLTISKPASVVSGDLLIAIVGTDDNSRNWAGPTGWVEQYDPGSLDFSLAIYTRVLDGSEGSSFDFTFERDRELVGFIIALRANGTYDVLGAIGTAATSGPLVAPSITASDGGVLLCICAGEVAASQDFSAPSGMTAAASTVTPGTTSMRVFYEEIEAGSTGTRTSTVTQNGDTYAWLLSFAKP